MWYDRKKFRDTIERQTRKATELAYPNLMEYQQAEASAASTKILAKWFKDIGREQKTGIARDFHWTIGEDYEFVTRRHRNRMHKTYESGSGSHNQPLEGREIK